MENISHYSIVTISQLLFYSYSGTEKTEFRTLKSEIFSQLYLTNLFSLLNVWFITKFIKLKVATDQTHLPFGCKTVLLQFFLYEF